MSTILIEWPHFMHRPSKAFFVQLTHSGVIEFQTANAATARWSVREVACSPDGAQSYDNLAIYEDRLERAEGVWRFAFRSYHYIWLRRFSGDRSRCQHTRIRQPPPEPIQCPPHLSITTV
jgi:hypothetical protein